MTYKNEKTTGNSTKGKIEKSHNLSDGALFDLGGK